MADLADPPVQQAMKRLQGLSRNEQDRYRALAREKALYDELYLLNDAREEGRPEGLLVARNTLIRLATRRFGAMPESAAQLVQQATPTQLDAWLDSILDAPTLEAVFHSSR